MFERAFCRWRRRHGLSRAEIAVVADTSTQAVWTWENGVHDPRISVVIDLERKYPGLFAELKRELKRSKRSVGKRRVAA